MSSPFRHFRKHSKTFMAVAAVLCMFIFVIGGAIGTGRSDDEGRAGGLNVVTWNGGSLNEAQLSQLVAQRVVVDNFLRSLLMEGGATTLADLGNVPPLLLRSQDVNQVELDVISTEVGASLAEDTGLTVSDSLINHFIEEYGLRKVGKEGVVNILSNIGNRNPRTNEAIVFSMLRKMLLAHFYRQSFADASAVVLPQQRWEDWRRVNERISVHAAILPTETFVSSVPEPKEAELKALYDEFKNADPDQFYSLGGRDFPSPDPGFAEPRRVRIQFLVGNAEARSKKFLDQVTDQEIADYYEQNKETDFIKMDLPGEEPQDEPAPSETPAADGESESAAEGKAAEEPAVTDAAAGETPAPESSTDTAAPETSGDPAPNGEDAAADPAPPASEPTTDAPAEEAAPATETPAEPTDDDASAADEAAPGAAVSRPSPFRLASYQDTPADEDQAADDETDASSTQAGSEQSEQDAPAETPPASSAAVPAEAASAPANESTPPADSATAADASATASPAADAQQPEAEPVEYEPLEKVREDIRQALATQKAIEELESVMNQATAQLQMEYNKYGLKVVQAEESKRPTPKPPAKLADLQWLADQHGLTLEKTALLTPGQLFETPLGKSADASTLRESTTEAMFTRMKLFEPFLARDRDNQWYLAIKTEDIPKRVPEFDEVKDKVLAAWKEREAAKLAEKKAQELAAQAEKSDKSFESFFAPTGYKVIDETAFFSWREYPVGSMGTGQPPGLGNVPELPHVGYEFMETAFSLDGNETKAVMNFDRSAALVIRLAKRQYTAEELRELFLEEENYWLGRRDMISEHRAQFDQAVTQEIEALADVEVNDAWLEKRAERARERN